jgi:hypothetical protein
MNSLNDQQLQRAKEILEEYLNAKPNSNGLTPIEDSKKLDEDRERVIRKELKPLIDGYLNGSVPLSDFKLKVDSISKRSPHWGFKGIKGQMFFNMF